MMRIGIGLPNQVRGSAPGVLPPWAARAEQAGFAAVATVGRIAYPGVMDTVALAAAAAVTRSVELFTTVMVGPVWPPVLLAKEIAGIDALSGGRLALGMGVGIREDDFVVEGLGVAGRGARFDRDLDTYRRVWSGELIGRGPNPAVTPGSREVPLMFGGTSPASYTRVARRGVGYIAGALPPAKVARSFEATRAAWGDAEREGSPRLVAMAYFALGDIEQGRSTVWDYYSVSGTHAADLLAAGMMTDPAAIKDTVGAFADIGATDLVFHPAVGDLDEVARLADIVL